MQNKLKSKNVVCGLGEIGKPIFQVISKKSLTVGYDLNNKLMNNNQFNHYKSYNTQFLHICIPFTKKFHSNVYSLFKKFNPEIIVIHSTISPYTTSKLQKELSIPIIYSPIRGVHKRMLSDLKRYIKWVKTKKMSNPIILELAKIIVDTSYYGWLINYAQLSNMIAVKHKVDYEEMWSFADEIHKYLGNRPKMFPGFIGGHCVIPNLDLINDKTLNLIKEINSDYGKLLKKRRKSRK
jgi:Fe-S cluster biosynthesis and repair protein YggX